MRRNPERTAWAVLWSAFASFCLLLYLIPAGASWLVQNATAEQVITLARSNIVYVQRPGRTSLEANLTDIPPGSSISTESNAQATLTFVARDGGVTIASVDIYGDTQLTIARAESPRFGAWSTAPHQIELTLTKGRLRLFTVADGGRAVAVRIESAPDTVTAITTPGVNASVVASFVQTTVTVREGRVQVSAQGQTLSLTSDQRAEVALGSAPVGPLPVERDLILDGDFAADFGAAWQKEIFTPVIATESPGLVAKTVLGGRPAVNFSRLGDNWGQVGLYQEINADVRGFASLRLQLDVYLSYQKLSNCGVQGTECPIMVKIKYVDLNGAEREWLQGFYYKFDPNPAFGLTFCGPCFPRYSDHLLVEPGQWKPYESGNLLEIWREAGAPAAVIKSISIYASGHSFDSNVAQVQLLVSE